MSIAGCEGLETWLCDDFGLIAWRSRGRSCVQRGRRGWQALVPRHGCLLATDQGNHFVVVALIRAQMALIALRARASAAAVLSSDPALRPGAVRPEAAQQRRA